MNSKHFYSSQTLFNNRSYNKKYKRYESYVNFTLVCHDRWLPQPDVINIDVINSALYNKQIFKYIKDLQHQRKKD